MATLTTFATSLITPPPYLAARATSINQEWGYWIVNASYTQELTCNPTEIFTTSSVWGGCYATTYVQSTSTLMYGCSEVSSLGSQVGGVTSCDNSCITQTIYQTFPTIDPLTNYFCADAWDAFTVYRTIPVTTSSSSSSTSSSSSSTPSQTSTPTSTSSTSSTTPSQTQTSVPTPSSSKAWIAGPVIGVLALIALIAFVLWFLRRRRQRANNNATTQQPPASYLDPNGKIVYNPVPQEMGLAERPEGYYGPGIAPKAELPSQSPIRGQSPQIIKAELPGWGSRMGGEIELPS